MRKLYNYSEAEKEGLVLWLRNGEEVEGELIQERIDPATLPNNRKLYEIREDDMGNDPASLKRGKVSVNYYGTFVTRQETGLPEGDEIEILDWGYFELDDEEF